MKKLILAIFLFSGILSIRAQSLTWTTWQGYDTTNTPDLIFHFTTDSVRFSMDNINWTTIGGYTYTANTFRMVDDPAQGCSNVTDTGVYTPVFSGDTMWLIVIYDSCSGRYDYLTTHYFVQTNTGIQESHAQDFSVHPNPSTGFFTVQTEAEPTAIRINTIDGKCAIDQQITGHSFTVDLSEYSAGIYFLSVIYSDHVTTQRIVKE